MSWFQAILELIAKALDLLKLNKQQQVEAAHTQQGVVAAKADAQTQVIDDVKVAEAVREGVRSSVGPGGSNPGGLFDDDGFRRD